MNHLPLRPNKRLQRTRGQAGRYVIDVRHGGRPWKVIVEPDDVRTLLVVMTAYPVE